MDRHDGKLTRSPPRAARDTSREDQAGGRHQPANGDTGQHRAAPAGTSRHRAAPTGTGRHQANATHSLGGVLNHPSKVGMAAFIARLHATIVGRS